MSYPSIISQPGSASRNVGPITEALSELLPPLGSSSKVRVLEIGSYPYEHIRSFAKHWSDIQWVGTVRDETELCVGECPGAYDAEVHCEGTNNLQVQWKSTPNLSSPEVLDVANDEQWQALHTATVASDNPFDGVILINLIHCMPGTLPLRIFHHLSPYSSPERRLLNPQRGWIAAYGPFLNDDGTYKSPGDEKFDAEYIRSKDSSLGLRSIASITQMAQRAGFQEVLRKEMPKGNMWVVWRVAPPP